MECLSAPQSPLLLQVLEVRGERWRSSGLPLFEPFREIVFTVTRVGCKLYYDIFQGKQLQ